MGRQGFVSTFDSGFKVARLLRHDWFRRRATRAGWKSGGWIIGATPDTSMRELTTCMNGAPDDEDVLLVISTWREDSAGEISMHMNTFTFLIISRKEIPGPHG